MKKNSLKNQSKRTTIGCMMPWNLFKLMFRKLNYEASRFTTIYNSWSEKSPRLKLDNKVNKGVFSCFEQTWTPIFAFDIKNSFTDKI